MWGDFLFFAPFIPTHEFTHLSAYTPHYSYPLYNDTAAILTVKIEY